MEVKPLNDRHINVSIIGSNPKTKYILGTSRAIKRKGGFSHAESFPKKQCVKRDTTIIKLKPSTLSYSPNNYNNSIAIYRPYKVVETTCGDYAKVTQISNDDKDIGLSHLDQKGILINHENSQPQKVQGDSVYEISNKTEMMSLGDSNCERKIGNALLLYSKKKKDLLKISGGGGIGFRLEDVQEFCADMVLDLEKWLQEQYLQNLESKLKEQKLNYVQFCKDNLLTEGKLINFKDLTLEENYIEPDYLG